MLRAYAVDSMTIHRFQGFDKWNQPIVAVDEAVKGYVDWKIHLVRDLAGEEIISRGIVTIIYDDDLTLDDFITIDSMKYAILDVRKIKDFSTVGLEIHIK